MRYYDIRLSTNAAGYDWGQRHDDDHLTAAHAIASGGANLS